MKRWRQRRNASIALRLRAGIDLDYARVVSGEDIAERHNTSQQYELSVLKTHIG